MFPTRVGKFKACGIDFSHTQKKILVKNRPQSAKIAGVLCKTQYMRTKGYIRLFIESRKNSQNYLRQIFEKNLVSESGLLSAHSTIIGK